LFNVQLSSVIFGGAFGAASLTKTLREAPPSAKRKRDSAQPQTTAYEN
jgi:hypothetical protein